MDFAEKLLINLLFPDVALKMLCIMQYAKPKTNQRRKSPNVMLNENYACVDHAL